MPIANYLGGAPPAVNSYSDSLQTADAANPLAGNLDGSKWIYAVTDMTNTSSPLDLTTYSIGLSSKDNANALLWSIHGAQNPLASCSSYMIPVTPYVALYGKTQFAQCTNVQATGVAGQGTISAGLAVMCNLGTSGQGFGVSYVFRVSSDDHSWLLQRLGVSTSTLASGAAATTADGDVLRLSADQSVAGQVTLTVKRNGVQLTQFVDNTGNRLLLGCPGLCSIAPTQGAGSPKSDWRTFSCGAGN